MTHCEQMPLIRYIVKNGNQQRINTPTIMPNVLAALVSMRNLFTWSLMLRRPILDVVLARPRNGFKWELLLLPADVPPAPPLPPSPPVSPPPLPAPTPSPSLSPNLLGRCEELGAELHLLGVGGVSSPPSSFWQLILSTSEQLVSKVKQDSCGFLLTPPLPLSLLQGRGESAFGLWFLEHWAWQRSQRSDMARWFKLGCSDEERLFFMMSCGLRVFIFMLLDLPCGPLFL